MNNYITGDAIKKLREKRNLTQLELAQRLCVSDKAVSKWETGRGLPDISLLAPLSDALNVSVSELLSGKLVQNNNPSANMLKTKLYVCPICGSKNLTKIDRMNGYLSYSRVHGDTRLNEAKMAEIAERKSM